MSSEIVTIEFEYSMPFVRFLHRTLLNADLQDAEFTEADHYILAKIIWDLERIL
jgi:hypothetical protein